MLNAVQGLDTSVRDTISQGRFVQGAQHPRTFGLGHIGRGHINPASSARQFVSRVSLRSIQSKGWDGSVRGKIAKGHFVQGMQHPRIFGRGHIGRGWTNIAPFNVSVQRCA
jgi:hypothetical protein